MKFGRNVKLGYAVQMVYAEFLKGEEEITKLQGQPTETL